MTAHAYSQVLEKKSGNRARLLFIDQRRRPHLDKGDVVGVIVVEFLGVQVHNVCDDLIEEVSVVGHDENGLLIRLQILQLE